MARSTLIGPNAILQLLPVLDDFIGVDGRTSLLRSAGIAEVPDGRAMVEETAVASLHQELRRELPDRAADIAWRAGAGTGDYVLRHRIPRLAVKLLPILPRPVSARLLARAISQHAWTFAGSGVFRVVSAQPPTFEIHGNPVVHGEKSDAVVCHWHAAVFERLYRRLVDPAYRFAETQCAARGEQACRFVGAVDCSST